MASKNSSGVTYGTGRTRNFATVLYPESAVDNWKSVLGELCIPLFISPLHDKDINPDGTLKKAHYHIMLMFDSVKTNEQANDIFSKVGGVGNEVVQSARGYARYLCHMDNPEKFQYSIDDVVSYGGADYNNVISLVTDKYKALGEMQDFCEQYNVISFYLLSKYARTNRMDWYRVLADSGSLFMREYLKSRQWTKERGQDSIIDQESGEIIC